MGLFIVTGGAGSGKSEYAERLACTLAGEKKQVIYVATMRDDGSASARERITRHRHLREGKGFSTVECPVRITDALSGGDGVYLIEDLTNLVANEIYDPEGSVGEASGVGRGMIPAVLAANVTAPMKEASAASDVIVVANELSLEAIDQTDGETRWFVERISQIVNSLAGYADAVTEVVCGIPVMHKGERQA